MWRGGCIIRSVFLGNIKAAYDKNAELTNLLLDDFFRDAIHSCQVSLFKHTLKVYAREGLELTPNVSRVEEKLKYLTQKLYSPTSTRRRENPSDQQ